MKPKTDKSKAHISSVRGKKAGDQPRAKRSARPAGTPVVGRGGRNCRK